MNRWTDDPLLRRAGAAGAAQGMKVVRGKKLVRVLWGKWSLTLGWMGPL